MMKYEFIQQERANFPVRRLCEVLQVAPSGYYAWLQRKPSPRDQANAELSQHIRRFHKRSRETYGSPRIYADLREAGWTCSRKRVARLMGQMGLQGRGRTKRRPGTTQADPTQAVAPNWLNQDFTASRPNEKWVADITYVDTAEGWLYLAVVLDIYSRKVVGWSMHASLHADLVLDALHMALAQRQPTAPLLHHSDRGSQYTSTAHLALLAQYGITVSMSRTANCYDNALMESFFATLKTECLTERLDSHRQARTIIFEFIEVWYNRQRRHSSLGYLSPHQFEALYV